MNLKSIKNNTSSPFHLQRSIVSQEEGAYANGGYNPNAVYNNDAANAAVEGLGTMIGAALTARGDKEYEKRKKTLEEGKKKVNETKITSHTINPEVKDEFLSRASSKVAGLKTMNSLETANKFMGNYKKYNKK
jgi:hypothetical protein